MTSSKKTYCLCFLSLKLFSAFCFSTRAPNDFHLIISFYLSAPLTLTPTICQMPLTLSYHVQLKAPGIECSPSLYDQQPSEDTPFSIAIYSPSSQPSVISNTPIISLSKWSRLFEANNKPTKVQPNALCMFCQQNLFQSCRSIKVRIFR